MKAIIKQQRGVTIMEALVSASLLTLVGVSVTRSSIVIISENARTVYRSYVTELAFDKLEELSIINPELLSDSNDGTEEITHEGYSFTRIIDVTINANRARHVSVTVESKVPGINASVTLENSFALWGRR